MKPPENWEKELRSLWQTTRENEGKYEKVKALFRTELQNIVEEMRGNDRDCGRYLPTAEWCRNYKRAEKQEELLTTENWEVATAYKNPTISTEIG